MDKRELEIQRLQALLRFRVWLGAVIGVPLAVMLAVVAVGLHERLHTTTAYPHGRTVRGGWRNSCRPASLSRPPFHP
mgnify:CR=1 FL=1